MKKLPSASRPTTASSSQAGGDSVSFQEDPIGCSLNDRQTHGSTDAVIPEADTFKKKIQISKAPGLKVKAIATLDLVP